MTQAGLDPAPLETLVGTPPVLVRLLDELPDAVIVINADGVLQWANRTAETLLGRSLTGVIGANGLDLVHPDDIELVLLSLSTVQDKRVGSPIEIRLLTTGGWRLMELIGSPVPWLLDGAILLTVRDLTQRRQYEIVHDSDARLRSLVQNSAGITMLVSPDGCIQSASGALTRILGQDPELVEGLPLADLVVEEDRPELAGAFERASRGASVAGPVKAHLSLTRHGNVGSLPFELAIVNLIDDPTVGGYVVTAHDITDQMAADLQLRKALSLLQATLDATADGIMVVGADGQIVSFNQRLIEMWMVPESVLSAGNRRKVTEFVSEQLSNPEEYKARVERVYQDREAESQDTLEFKDGRVFERISRPQRVDGEIVGRVWCFRDVTERKRLEQRLSYQAFHDSLTGLANRALFQDRLAHGASRMARCGGHLAVLFVDLDNLKAVNDSFGHAAGDAVLEATARTISGCLRECDSVGRLGGDEFGILLEDVDGMGDVLGSAERVRTAIRRPVHVAGQEIVVTACIGVALDVPGQSTDQLLCNADLATFAAKELGGDRISEFTDTMHAAIIPAL
jgi:diguanylate cyclase (GGDEF)-like protein/PAS domain S-box-containing protein